MNSLVALPPYVGLIGLFFALLLFVSLRRRPAGNEKMQEIAALIHTGAMAFLKREYTILAGFVVVVALLLAWQLNVQTMLCFISGAILSILAGFIGMQAATKANTRTSEAARSQGVGEALMVAFFGGSVMGLAVAGLALPCGQISERYGLWQKFVC